MSTMEKQNEFDKKKWEDSIVAGHDTCGEYDYCAKCNKSNEYPCAKAYDEFSSVVVSVETTPVVAETSVVKSTTKKAPTKKTCAKKTATKSTTKKTCAKKSTTKTATKAKKTTK